MKQICTDLNAEHEELEGLLNSLDDEQWDLITPFYDWTIRKEIEHLAYFDDRATLAASDPEAFQKHLAKEIFVSFEAIDIHTKKIVGQRSIQDLFAWWQSERRKLLAVLEQHEPKNRLLWYGPPMSALSFATARLMETWAHAQDVFDTLKLKRQPTDRLRHIAHLGVNTYGWTFINKGLAVPEEQVRVELKAPSGELWTWGPEDTVQKIKGSAEGFCLVVVQRRHVDDTDLHVVGETARDWMLKAQCFAGAPAYGPKPGQRLV